MKEIILVFKKLYLPLYEFWPSVFATSRKT